MCWAALLIEIRKDFYSDLFVLIQRGPPEMDFCVQLQEYSVLLFRGTLHIEIVWNPTKEMHFFWDNAEGHSSSFLQTWGAFLPLRAISQKFFEVDCGLRNAKWICYSQSDLFAACGI